MKASITSSKPYGIAAKVGAVVFWLIIWEISARLVDVRFLFPTVTDIIVSLGRGVITADFWLSILFSLLRILLGFLIGAVVGIGLALLSLYPVVHLLLQPIVTVARCTPVASFIMILWLLISDPFIPTIIALFMVFPVVWQSAYGAISSPPHELSEIASVYGFTKRKRILYLTLPTMLKSTLPGIITASGLAWKAGVAAEIITYTESSIGKNISEAKNYLEGADMFAWTAVVVLLSLIVEGIIKHYSRKAVRMWEY